MAEDAIPVVVGLLLRGNAVLMCERPVTKIYPLYWEFPGGKVEPGESLGEALARELREELGVETERPEQYFTEIASYSNGMTYAITYFLVREFQPEPRNIEFSRIAFVDEATLPTLLHLSGNDRILRKFYEEGLPR